MDVLVHYSGTNPPQCANPYGEHEKPYTTLEALSIDHIKALGRKKKLELYGQYTGGVSFYWWLKRHNYPSGFQVLCMNCQYIKRMRNHEVRGRPRWQH